MRPKLTAFLFGTALLAALSGVADACNRDISARAAQTIVPGARINQGLLDDAIRTEVNYHRCRIGLSKVGDAGRSLARQAERHSKWMARRQQLTHQSTVSGAATLEQRIRAAGVRFRSGSENIGMVHRYQIDNRRFKILNSSQCQFATQSGQRLEPHSYASLARHIVDLWMDSPGHRRNILDGSVDKMTTGIAFDPKSQYCGRFWVTQNFIG